MIVACLIVSYWKEAADLAMDEKDTEALQMIKVIN